MEHQYQHHQLKQLNSNPTPPPLLHLQEPQPLSHILPPPPTFKPINTQKQEDQLIDNKNNILHYFPTTPTPTSYALVASSDHLTHTTNSQSISPPAGGVRYKECLKNHAATKGTNVVDGCGEFLPSGLEGTLEALKCAACQCHRNFHRRDIEVSPNSFSKSVSLYHVQPLTVANTDSSSDDLVQVLQEMPQKDQLFVEAGGSNRKRFRTKFSQEQKTKMVEFAEKLEWRLQRQDDEMVERFCNEVGVRRQVLKVWMHNNKNSFKKLSDLPPHEQQQPQLQHHHLLHPHHHQQQAQQETLCLDVKGAFRESNSGPLAPKARIIPLDQMPAVIEANFNI